MIEIRNIYTLEEDLERGVAKSIASDMGRQTNEYFCALINKLTERIEALEAEVAKAPAKRTAAKAEASE